MGTSGEIDVVDDALWIDGHDVTGTNVVYTPSTDRIENAPVQGPGPVALGGLIWYVDNRTSLDPADSVVVGADPSTGQTVASLAVPRAAAISGSGNMLWVASRESRAEGSSSVTLIEVTTRTIVGGPIDIEPGPLSMIASDDAAWIGNYDTGGLTKVSVDRG